MAEPADAAAAAAPAAPAGHKTERLQEVAIPDRPNTVYEHAKKVSDYFAMALRVGVGSGAAVGLWEYARHHPESAFGSELFSVGIGLSTLYLAVVFVAAVGFDLRGGAPGGRSRMSVAADIVSSLVALSLLVSLVYFARTTAMEMMR